MKTKTFYGDPSNIDHKINSWVESQETIEIQSIQPAMTFHQTIREMKVLVMILYKNLEDSK